MSGLQLPQSVSFIVLRWNYQLGAIYAFSRISECGKCSRSLFLMFRYIVDGSLGLFFLLLSVFVILYKREELPWYNLDASLAVQIDLCMLRGTISVRHKDWKAA